MDNDNHKYTLKLIVRNKPGVLIRCVQVFTRRSHNIEALNVVPEPNNSSLSKMTIMAYGSKQKIDNIVSQIKKLVDVINIEIA